MTIFLVLNGMAVVFMLYVLVNFWKEGRRTTRGGVRSFELQSLHGRKREVFVVTRHLEFEAGRSGKRSLLRFPIPEGRPREDQILAGYKRSPHPLAQSLPRAAATHR